MGVDTAMKHEEEEEEDEKVIKPQALVPTVDTSDWPLLLKNFDKCRIRPPSSTSYLALELHQAT
jgi:H/ACA ribonucleoprotein complex subunit 4